MKTPVLYIIVPCYNEEAVLPITCSLFLNKITELAGKGKISDGCFSSTTVPGTKPGRSSRT